MPSTYEFVCSAESCTLDMFEVHATYDMPGDVGADDFSCPYCGGSDLETVTL